MWYTKINSKWVKELNIRPETIKFLEKNIEEQLHNTGFSNDFLDMTPKTQATKGKIDKWDYINLKTSVQQRVQSTEWEGNLWNERKILANHISDKSLPPEYIKSSYTSMTKTQMTQFKNGQRTCIYISPNKIYKWKWKMFNITNHQGNANQNRSKISPHTHQDDHSQENRK